MNIERISEEAGRLYSEYLQNDSDIEMERTDLRDAAVRATNLRLGYELTSYGLGGEYAQRQADIIAENTERYTIPRLEEALASQDANLKAAVLHLDKHFEEYVEMAKAEMQADKAVKHRPH